MKKEVYEKLQYIFRDVFDDDSIVLTDETTAQDVEGWDSLIHITLMEAVESEFDIKFSMKDIVKLKNVGQLVDAIIGECERKA